MEKKILTVVSDVTGVSESDIMSENFTLDVARARQMYYYLCNEHNMRYKYIGRYVKKSPSAVGKGIRSYEELIKTNGKYKALTKRAEEILSDGSSIDTDSWMRDYERCVYHKGIKYSVVDVSSRYFGKGYMCMAGDKVIGYTSNLDEAVWKIMTTINEIK